MRDLCPVCGTVMDQWLKGNGYDKHINCVGKPTALDRSAMARPYTQDGQPSAGWSGTDTSKDGEPIRATSQKQVFDFVASQQEYGATVKEAREFLKLHHGVTSGALSVLHKRKYLFRLTEKRDRCRVYVHPIYVRGRGCD